MGDNHYDGDVGERQRSSLNDHFSFRGYASDPTQPTQREVHPLLNIKGKIRECRDSAEHPNTKPIAVVMDDTRSRGDDAKVIYGKLPMFIGQLIMKGWVQHPVISFAAVGDATCGDKAPIQVGQFESDNRLDEVLGNIWLEEGGGGTGQESYELLAYYYATHTELDCLKRGEKGILFFLGDEGFYPKISKDQVKRLIGDSLPEDLDSGTVFAKLQEKYDVFFIYPKKTWQERKTDIDEEIRKRVLEAGAMHEGVDVRFSLIWDNRNDLDLHVIAPSGEHIYFSHKHSRCGGELDVDRNVHGETTKPIENTRWPKGRAPKGKYEVFVQNFAYHEPSREATPFRVESEINGKIAHFEGIAPVVSVRGGSSDVENPNNAANVFVGEFEFDPDERPEAVDRYAGYDDTLIRNQWAGVIPDENILVIDDPRAIVDVMLGAIALSSGAGLDQYVVDMGERGQTQLRQGQVRRALEGFSDAKAGAIVKVSGTLPGAPGKNRSGKTKRL
ncbi:MAG: hypothetical protein HGA31_00180 [Candidatus Moranbacteria bacterium]|nr:hypothetical protein [Candidatus Moranbacteria bacterium]